MGIYLTHFFHAIEVECGALVVDIPVVLDFQPNRFEDVRMVAPGSMYYLSIANIIVIDGQHNSCRWPTL